MPKSRNKRKNGKTKVGYIAPGANKGQNKLSKRDILNKNFAFEEKIGEFQDMELSELVEIQESGSMKGIYGNALELAITAKRLEDLQEQQKQTES